MTIEEKIEMITYICDGLKDDLIRRIPKTPDNWDRAEILRWIQDYCEKKYDNTRFLGSKKLREYNNDIMTKPYLL